VRREDGAALLTWVFEDVKAQAAQRWVFAVNTTHCQITRNQNSAYCVQVSMDERANPMGETGCAGSPRRLGFGRSVGIAATVGITP
jgi:hypothetical protein